MPTCAQPSATYTAEPGNLNGIREGWLAEAADDLSVPAGDRYVGRSATAASGAQQSAMYDCASDCLGRGMTFSSAIGGLIKEAAALSAPVSPCGSIVNIGITTQWVPHQYYPCLNQAIAWWRQNHYDRTVAGVMTGSSPNCSISDLSPAPGYPVGCAGPLIAQGLHGSCVSGVDECNVNPTTDFLYAESGNQVQFSIADGGTRVVASINGGHAHRASDGINGYRCCTTGIGNYFPIGAPIVYDGPPANPNWPVNDSRRYAGSYQLTNNLDLLVHSAQFVVSFP